MEKKVCRCFESHMDDIVRKGEVYAAFSEISKVSGNKEVLLGYGIMAESGMKSQPIKGFIFNYCPWCGQQLYKAKETK